MNKEKITERPNLLILGIACVSIAVITTVVSLIVYKNSGDIYLDRSRPGFLPDGEDASPVVVDYKFKDSGKITSETLDEYLNNLDDALELLDALEDPFSSNSLSDDSLGIFDPIITE